jgi:hypothetical protein
VKVLTRGLNFETYEGELINRSLVDIKPKSVILEPAKKTHLFLDTSTTSIDTYVPSLYKCVETRSIEVF